MSAYIPLIKTTRWIDLSSDHNKLRKELEDDLERVCVKKEQLQPIMLQGAFGIGKTNTLYYLFHYGWCELKTPIFLVSLDVLTKSIKNIAEKQPSGKIQNSELGPFIKDILQIQIESLKKNDWVNLSNIYFPEFKDGDLNKYLKDFQNVEIIEDSKKGTHKLPNSFSKEVIKQAINSGNRPVLLIDEFESKFYELKKYIETSGGGVLRELFDQIVQDTDSFYLIIGNGPASGYEIAKERGDESIDSETAANRRLKTKSLPFPTSNLLKRSFLKDDPKGYINFIWWLSRCRPGHILKLRDSLGTIEELDELNTNEIITKAIFKEPIDEGGEAVTYLKTSFFNEIPGKIQAAMLNKLLTSFEPRKFEIKDCKEDLKKCIPYFYCATDTIKTGKELLSVLREDFFTTHLQKYQEEGDYLSVNYIESLQPYFSYILNGISDKDDNIAFGMINDSKTDSVISETFLIPLLELTYDFISLYQDDSVKETRETLDFLLKIINIASEKTEKEELETFIPNTFDLFEKCKLLRNNDVYLQLSLYSIRQSIEQPIGSPKLKYKNQQLDPLLKEISSNVELPIIYHIEDNFQLYFIPDLEGDLLEKYISSLEKYLNDIFIDNFHKKGELIIRVIYLAENERVEEFKTNLLCVDSDKSKPEPIVILNKIKIINLESYQLNFGSQIKDYLDSVSKIGIIGLTNGELEREFDENDETTLKFRRIIELIGERPWTDKKETIRTIEHYKKLLLDGDNSVFKSIFRIAQQEYDEKLAELICNKADFRNNISEYSYIDKIISDNSEAYNPYTISLALLYLFENNEIKTDLKNLLKMVKDEYKFEKDKSVEKTEEIIDYKNLLQILTKNKEALEYHKNNFLLNSNFISKLSNFSKLLNTDTDFENIKDLSNCLKANFNSHFIESYHSALGTATRTEITKTIYNLKAAESIKIEEEKLNLSNDSLRIKTQLNKVRTEIVDAISEFKDLLDEDRDISNYAKLLSKALEGLNLVDKLLNDSGSYSLYIILHSITQQLETVLNNSKNFLIQFNNINETISDYNEKVSVYQSLR